MSSKFALAINNFTRQFTILIFDSGVGGLSIYNEVKKILPTVHYLYCFDNEAFPYGEKTTQFIINRVFTLIKAIWQKHKIDLIIIACNTASVVSLPTLRQYFPCPIIGVVPAIKLATKLTRNGIIGLLATNATIQCSYTHNLIKQNISNCQCLKLGTAELVEIAEAKLQGKLVVLPVLRKLLYPWLEAMKPPDTIVLGCTHFPLLNKELQAVLPKGTCLVDSGSAIARRAVWIIEHDMNISNLSYNKTRLNKAYCLTATSEIVTLLPTFIQYGFSSIKILTL